MRFGSLFTGIGGLDLGLERAGMTCAWQVEIDPYATRVLEKHWPGVKRHTDIRDAHTWQAEHRFKCEEHCFSCLSPHVDLICGGFPCQDISVAGKGKGLAGERSGLWREYRRIVEEIAPKWVLIENVPALRTRGLRTVLSDLHALGYDAEWDGVSASAVGAPHRRDRLFVVAYAAGLRRERRRVFKESPGRSEPSNSGQAVADAVCIGRKPENAREGRSVYNLFGLASIKETRRKNLELRPSQPGQWAAEPDMGGTSDGFPGELDLPGVAYETKAGAREVLRTVRSAALSGAIQRATRGLGLVQAQEVLFTVVRELESGSRLSRELLESEATPGEFVREVLGSDYGASRASLRRGPVEQLFREHPDAMRKLSQLVASRGETPWSNPLWESATTRVAHGIPSRVDRLRGLGNAVVPQVAEHVGRLIMGAK